MRDQYWYLKISPRFSGRSNQIDRFLRKMEMLERPFSSVEPDENNEVYANRIQLNAEFSDDWKTEFII